MKSIFELVNRELVNIMPIAIATIVMTTMMMIVFNNENFSGDKIYIIMTFVFLMLITYVYSRSRIPSAYNVAIVGFPKSGKTTLLTAMFDEIFKKKYTALRINITSESTIERVNEDLATIQKGHAIGPTTDQDKISYSTNIVIGNLFRRTYKVEFADFPGEDSEEYAKKYGKWLHTTEYFKWVREADGFIFVIDICQYLLKGNDYIADINSSIRAAWQNIHLTKEKGSMSSSKFPVLLVFTKADLLNYEIFNSNNKNLSKDEITHIGLSDFIPHMKEIDNKLFEEHKRKVLDDFDALISFFNKDISNFKTIFTSSFATINKKRLGVEEIFLNILPKNI